MDIYILLSSKTHNKHYLDRYLKFISSRNLRSIPADIYTENHHICPKAKDMFPEYKNLKEFKWNSIILTAREHFIAHWMLWKAFGGSQVHAFWLLGSLSGTRIKSSRLYSNLRSQR